MLLKINDLAISFERYKKSLTFGKFEKCIDLRVNVLCELLHTCTTNIINFPVGSHKSGTCIELT